MLPVAILGIETFDVTQSDPATVLLEGVAPLQWAFEEVATPYEPFTGKQDTFDCTAEGPDGFSTLILNFDTQEVVETTEMVLGREVEDGEMVVLTLIGNLLEEFDGTPIQGEDVVVIQK